MLQFMMLVAIYGYIHSHTATNVAITILHLQPVNFRRHFLHLYTCGLVLTLRHPVWQQVKVADAELLTDWQRKNKEYKQRHQMNAHRESDTMARLMKFRQHLQKPAEQKQPVAAPTEAAVRPDADAAEPNRDPGKKAESIAADDEEVCGHNKNRLPMSGADQAQTVNQHALLCALSCCLHCNKPAFAPSQSSILSNNLPLTSGSNAQTDNKVRTN